jgi:hypothetical protein
MAQMIDHLDLTTGEEVDSVEKKTAVLAGFWAKMKSSGNYFEPEQSAAEIADSLADEALRDQQQEKYAEELSRAESASQIQEINTRYGFRPERDSSGVFGR